MPNWAIKRAPALARPSAFFVAIVNSQRTFCVQALLTAGVSQSEHWLFPKHP
jgi:hypothetical protein